MLKIDTGPYLPAQSDINAGFSIPSTHHGKVLVDSLWSDSTLPRSDHFLTRSV